MDDRKFGPDAWELWRSMFKDGDEVVAILDTDAIVYGKIKAKPLTAEFKRMGQKPVVVDWDDIRFIAHDGFPVRKLLGADGSELIENIDTRSIQKKIRKTLTHIYCPGCGEVKPAQEFPRGPDFYTAKGYCGDCRDALNGEPTTPLGHTKSMVFGDPFLIEDVDAKLLNPGSVYLGGGFENWKYEEVVAMRSRDGANGLLYDLFTVYDFEAA